MKSYSQEFSSTKSVEDYANRQYANESFGALVHQIEVDLLYDLLSRHFATPPRHLDFACGTGRIAGALAQHTASTAGVDISPEMIKVAETQHPLIDFQSSDLLAEVESSPGVGFDLITAFRFLLNAEVSLAERALERLPKLLANDGLLIVNIHSCIESYRVFPWLWRRLARALPDADEPVGLFAKRAAVKELFDAANLEIVDSRPYGYLPNAFRRVVGNHFYRKTERLISRIPGARSLGTHRVYVLRPGTR